MMMDRMTKANPQRCLSTTDDNMSERSDSTGFDSYGYDIKTDFTTTPNGPQNDPDLCKEVMESPEASGDLPTVPGWYEHCHECTLCNEENTYGNREVKSPPVDKQRCLCM